MTSISPPRRTSGTAAAESSRFTLTPLTKPIRSQHFGTVEGGTGIRFYNGALYAASPSAVYRFTFSGKALVPSKEPEVIVDGMPTTHPGFNRVNRPLAFDGKGNLFVALDGSANICTAPTSAGTPPVGLKPCPDLGVRAGIWRFDANKVGQKFPADGEQLATGIRDIDCARLVPCSTEVSTASCTAGTPHPGPGPI